MKFPGASKSSDAENYRIKLFKVPQLGKVKANRRRPMQPAFFYLLDERGQSLIHGGPRLQPRIQQDVSGQGRLLDAARHAWGTAPASVGPLLVLEILKTAI